MSDARARRFGRGIAAIIAVLVAQSAYAQLQVLEPQILPRPPDPAPADPLPAQFGAFAITDGRTILVSTDRGRAAYSYIKNRGGVWSFEGELVGPLQISYGIALRGDTALTQSRASGNAFVFQRSDHVWTQTQSLPDVGSPISRRTPLGLGRDFAALGNWEVDGAHGAVFIYDKVGAGTYIVGPKLSPSGTGVTLTGSTLIVDGNVILTNSGGQNKLTTFVRVSGVWTEEAVLTLPGGVTPSPEFGFSGKRAVVPAFGIDPLGPAYTFVHRNGSWSPEQLLTSPANPQRSLGPEASIDGRRLIIADTQRETVYVFERHKGSWAATAELHLPDACEQVPRLWLSRRIALVACGEMDPGEIWKGQVLVFELPKRQDD